MPLTFKKREEKEDGKKGREEGEGNLLTEMKNLLNLLSLYR
jgi:hypothetical protein